MIVKVSPLHSAHDDAIAINADVVVSLVDQDMIVPHFGVPHLIIRVDDTEIHTDPFAPKLSDIQVIFAFAKMGDRVLVHCIGAVSRSTAVGIGLMVAFNNNDIDTAVRTIHNQHPNMAPNRLILQHIDTHMSDGGAFVSGVQKVLDGLPKDYWLWCDSCKRHFVDGTRGDCPSGKWSK